MFKEIVNTIEQSQIYSIISLLLFFGLFVGVIWRVIRMDKSHVDRMSRLPIESSRPEREEYHG